MRLLWQVLWPALGVAHGLLAKNEVCLCFLEDDDLRFLD